MSWNSLQELIGGLKVPAFFTDYCEEAGVMAGQAIAFFTTSPLTFPVGFAISVEGFSCNIQSLYQVHHIGRRCFFCHNENVSFLRSIFLPSRWNIQIVWQAIGME